MSSAAEAKAALVDFEQRHDPRYIWHFHGDEYRRLIADYEAACEAEGKAWQPEPDQPRERVEVDPDRAYDEERYRQMTEPPLMFSDDPDR